MSDYPELSMQVGDIVTRAGVDRHIIRSLTEDKFSGEFECIVPDYWCSVGEVESNLCRRYSVVEARRNDLPE